MKQISTQNAPAPAGHYTQAIEVANMVFVSGQLPINPKTGEKVIDTIENQALQAFENMKAIIEAANCTLANVAKTTVYISDIDLWPKVNAVYADFFGDHKPARAIVPTRELHHGFQIEIEAILIKE